jgi:DNA invertase Pin-like site-specific DNA recombinase
MIHILAAFAEHERTLISERTKAALTEAKRRGIELGTNGKKLAIKNGEAAVSFAETMRPMVSNARAAGAVTLNDFATALNLAGHRTREGRPWTPSTTSRLLARLSR